MIELIAIVQLMLIHDIEGRDVWINPKLIIRMADGGSGRVVTERARCVLVFVDGKFLSVSETCAQVRTLIEQYGSK